MDLNTISNWLVPGWEDKPHSLPSFKGNYAVKVMEGECVHVFFFYNKAAMFEWIQEEAHKYNEIEYWSCEGFTPVIYR